MLEVKIKSISITDIGFVVFLQAEGKSKVLPIFIGPVEAQAISMILMKNRPKRPMPHDLMKNILDQTDLIINKVEIVEIRNETYFANLYLQKKGMFSRSKSKNYIVIDSRPSDGIALALRYGSPIFVKGDLIDDHGVELQDDEPVENVKVHTGSTVIPKSSICKTVNEELGMYLKMLEEAVKEDRFEDATKLRDKIDEIIGKNN